MIKYSKKYALLSMAVSLSIAFDAHCSWFSNFGSFLHGLVRNPRQVGALAPCSPFVGKAITRPLRKEIESEAYSKSLRILEVGAGSGVLTTAIAETIADFHGNIHVDVVEIDQGFCTLLEQKFQDEPRVNIHCADITTWVTSEKYDFIITSLPFNNLPADVVESILLRYQDLLNDNGVVSYVEFMLLPTLMKLISRGQKKRIFNKRRAVLDAFRNNFIHERVGVWFNVTPIYVHNLYAYSF